MAMTMLMQLLEACQRDPIPLSNPLPDGRERVRLLRQGIASVDREERVVVGFCVQVAPFL
jgi:hypothetical protein